MKGGFFILAVLFLLCLSIRSGYELLRDARTVNPESTPIVVLVFTAPCVLWVWWPSLGPMNPFQANLPDAIRWNSLSLFFSGMVLAVGALTQHRGVENIDHLVTTGLFRKFWHPMCTGVVLWFLGWGTYHGAMVSLDVELRGIASITY